MSQDVVEQVEQEVKAVPTAAASPTPLPATSAPTLITSKRRLAWRRRAGWVASLVVLAALVVYVTPVVVRALNTVSTDDAYVNGHVTFVAPRVAGQVMEVLVDDNMRVKKGSLLVRLDKEPYEVRLEIKKAAVATAEADQVAAQAGVRSLVAQARANRFKLDHAIEDVKNQVANLHANVATLHSREASLVLAKANLKRREGLIVSRTITQEELDDTRQQAQVAEAQVEEAREKVYATRVSLGLAPKPEHGDLKEVPEDIYENFSTIRQALGDLMQSAAQFGFAPAKWNATPKEAIAEFYKQDPAEVLGVFWTVQILILQGKGRTIRWPARR